MSEEDSFAVPDSYDQSQPQTQQATQQSTQPLSQPTQYFPKHLWGVLVSTSVTPTADELAKLEKENDPAQAGAAGVGAATGDDEAYVPRPARVEMARGTFECKIGRHPHADVVLKGKKISNWHARIFVDPTGNEEGVRLEDTSTNGTFVRGNKVGKGKVTLLEPGDEIIFGAATSSFMNDFRYVFKGPHGTRAPNAQPWGIAESSGGGIHDKYDVREQIGKGSFATVRKGIQRATGNMVAIKIIQKARFASNPKTMEMISREVEIMKNLDHKYCVRYIDYFEDEQRMWLVMEYVDGGDLLDYVMKRQGLSESDTREIALMVCEAVAYLHSKGVAHRDLKPENLLLTRGARPLAKVTDFGLAKMVDNNTMLRTACGTPSYLAPEVILKEAQAGYGAQVDAWSIGVVLYSCMTNSTPFDESESTPLPQRMAERRVDFNGLEEYGISEIAIDFLRQLLVVDPTKRMSVKDALAHPWLATAAPTNGPLTALPLHVSTLPFNDPSSHSERATVQSVPFGLDTPSLTSAGVSGDDSFAYSQGLHNLRLGTPMRSMTSASQTTPERHPDAEEGGSTDAGDQTTIGLPTPIVSETAPPLDADATIHPSHSHSPSTKRKEPASASSSASDVEAASDDGAGSAMSLDEPGARMKGKGRNIEPMDEREELEELEEEAKAAAAVKGAKGAKRRSIAATARTPAPRRKAGARGGTPATDALPSSSQETSAVDDLPGPTTRRRAKVARLS
ncbi:hypothetical protein RQP46_009250 [Phenoliferia psychrophenolica]